MLKARDVLVVVLLLAGAADASTEVDAGALVVRVEDQRSDDCVRAAVARGCAFSSTVGEEGAAGRVDLYQEVHYVGVATDPSALPDPLRDLALLPDHSLVLRGGDLYLRNPAAPAAASTWRDAAPDVGGAPAGVILDSQEAGVYYEGPVLTDLAGPSGRQELGVEYAHQGGGVGYEQVGPFHDPAGGSTDGMWPGFHHAACNWGVEEAACYQAAASATGAVEGATPNVEAGVQLHEVQVATDEALLHAAEGARAASQAVPFLGSRPPPLHVHDPRAPAPLPPLAAVERPAPAAAPPPALGPRATAASPLATAGATVPQGVPEAGALARLGAGVALSLVLSSLYTRIERRSVLDHPARLRLHDLVRDRPGTGLCKLAEEAGLTRNAALHHLLTLERHQFVVSRKSGRTLAYFPPEMAPGRDSVRRMLLLGHGTRRRVALELLGEPVSQRDVEERTGLSQRLISYHLSALVEAGWALAHPGKPVRYAAAPTLAAALGEEPAAANAPTGAPAPSAA